MRHLNSRKNVQSALRMSLSVVPSLPTAARTVPIESTDGKSNTNYVSDEHEDFYSFEIVVDPTRPYPVNGIRLQNGNAKKSGN